MTLVEKSVDPRVKRTRKLLQQAFLEVFVEKDIESISIQEITERATVNRATFYAHFPDKYALLDSIVRELFQQALAQHLPVASVWNVQSLPGSRATGFVAHLEWDEALLFEQESDQQSHSRCAEMLSGLKPCLRTLVRTTFGFLGDFHHDCQPGHRQFSVLIERAIQEELAEVVLTWLNATPFGSTFGDWGICEARMGEALAVSA